MQKLRAIFIGVLLIFSLNVLAAEKAKDSPCDNNSYCVDGAYFSVEVTKISKRGNIIIIQLKYTGKHRYDFDIGFGPDKEGVDRGYAAILDANGNEFVIDGSKIGGFTIDPRQDKIMSLKFKSDKQIIEPFDLTLKAWNREGRHGEITLFDLNSADFSNNQSNNPDVEEAKTKGIKE